MSTATERTEDISAPSNIVPVKIVAGCTHADHASSSHCSTLICRARDHSGWLSQRPPSGQWPDQRPKFSCPPPQWLAEPTQNERTVARAASTRVVSATTVAGWAKADPANRDQSNALTSRTRQTVAGYAHTERTEDRAAPSTLLPAKTVAGCAHADRANSGQCSTLPVVPATTVAG